MKAFLAWIGQNATTGTAHSQTGLMSTYGGFRAFSSKQRRNDFVANYYNHSNPSSRCFAVNMKEARALQLGISVALFNETIMMLETES